VSDLVYGNDAAAAVAGVNPRTVRRWQQRGFVTVTHELGMSVYVEAELLAMRKDDADEPTGEVEADVPDVDGLLSIQAAAEVLGIRTESVTRAMSEERLAWVRDDRGRRRLTSEAVEAYRVARESRTVPSYKVTENDLSEEAGSEPASSEVLDELDERAGRLLQLGLSHACLLREMDPAAARRSLAHLAADELLDLVTLLAACVDIDQPTSVMTAWFRMRSTVQAVA